MYISNAQNYLMNSNDLINFSLSFSIGSLSRLLSVFAILRSISSWYLPSETCRRRHHSITKNESTRCSSGSIMDETGAGYHPICRLPGRR